MDEHASFEPQAVLTPRRGRGNRVGVAVAALVVTVTVGVGLIGRLGDGRLGDGQADRAAVAPSAIPLDAAVLNPTDAPPSLSNYHPPSLPRYPGAVLGLQVWTAAYVSKYGFSYFGGSIAVSGWYAAQPHPGCPTPRFDEIPTLAQEFGVGVDAETFCARTGNLFTAPLFGEMATPIGIELRRGVAGPYELNDVAVVTPVVLVGRLAKPDTPCSSGTACQAHMVVDHTAWAGGTGVSSTASILPRLLADWPPLGSEERDSLSVRAIGYQGTVLMETLVDPRMLRRIDPHAAEILAAAAPEADRVWYRRVLGQDPAQDPMRWITIDDATGELIASGFEG